MVAVFVLLSAVVGREAVGLTRALHLPAPGFVGLIILFLVALQVTVLAHEAGHLMMARLAGFQPKRLAALAVRVVWVDGKARLERPGGLAVVGRLTVEPIGSAHLDRRLAVLAAGGPVANLLLGAALAVPVFWLAPGWIAFVLLCCSCLSLIGGLLNLAPYRSGAGRLTDGAKVLRLWQSDPAVRREMAVEAIGALVTGDVRPRAVPQELLNQALAPHDATAEQARAEAIAAMCALDQGEVGAATQHLNRALALIEQVPAPDRPPYYLQAAYMAARYQADEALVASCMDRLDDGGTSVQPFSWAVGEGAVALLAGEYGRVLEMAEERLKELAEPPVSGLSQMEAELLEDLVARAKAAMAAAGQVPAETTA